MSVQGTYEASRGSDKVAKAAGDVAVAGQKCVDISRSVLEQITKHSVSEIRKLNEQIIEINSILKMINEITGQVNLLALDAAIEGTCAVEHGRGFAVVTGEVKNLAADSP